MDWGLQNRMANIIRPADGRAVMLAVDHGYFLGPTEKLEDPKRTLRPLVKHCDSLMITRGVLRNCVDANHPVPIVLRVSGGSSIIGDDLSDEQITTSIKDAIRLNVSALAMSIFVGGKHERQSIVNLGRLVNEAEEYGIPVLAVTAVGKDMGKDARYLSLACRIAAEQGARIVKTYYCKDFEKVVKSCPVPIIIAGGKKIPEREALELTHNAIKAGAVGVDMGRNIWQSENPVQMIRAVRAIVHGNLDVTQAYNLYKELCGEKPVPGQKNRPQPNQQGRPQQSKPQQGQQKKPQQDMQKNRPQSNQQKRPQQNQHENKPQQKKLQSGQQKDRPQSDQQKRPQQDMQKNRPQQDQQQKPQQNQQGRPQSDQQKRPQQNMQKNRPQQDQQQRPQQDQQGRPQSDQHKNKPQSDQQQKPQPKKDQKA